MIPQTKDEKSLLLFLETQAVDGGKITSTSMNAADFDIARRWKESGYIQFGRIPYEQILFRGVSTKAHWVALSDEAWADVAILRQERGKRNLICYAEQSPKIPI